MKKKAKGLDALTQASASTTGISENETETNSGKSKPSKPAKKQAGTQFYMYMQKSTHDQLRDLAHHERISMAKIMLEGLDEVFKKRGLKSIKELSKEK
ncbi:MAG TPA: hypothetical protein ENJ33_04025 [Thiothrix sp.]|nr:hypothetical protein [Thiothrix sp.]